MKVGSAWATSLAQAARERLPALRLQKSTELVCENLMCEKVGEACLCRLSIHLSKLRHLRHLDLRGNGLDRLPELWTLPQLETLDVRDNLIGACAQAARARAHRAHVSACTAPSIRRVIARGARLHENAARAARGGQSAASRAAFACAINRPRRRFT